MIGATAMEDRILWRFSPDDRYGELQRIEVKFRFELGREDGPKFVDMHSHVHTVV
jgi:hypothetical protein